MTAFEVAKKIREISAELSSITKSEVNTADETQKTPLHYATSIDRGNSTCLSTYYDATLIILKKGANINARDAEGMTALHYTVHKPACYEIDYNASSLWICPELCDAEIMFIRTTSLLLDLGAEIDVRDKSGMSPLHYGIYHENVYTIILLLGNNADVKNTDKKGETPLGYARKLQNTKKTQKKRYELSHIIELLTCGIDFFFKKNERRAYFFNIIKSGCTELVKVCLNAGVEVNITKDSEPLLHWAIDFGNGNIIKLLLEDIRTDVNILNSKGESLLHKAIQMGNENIIKLLLQDIRTDVNVITSEDEGPDLDILGDEGLDLDILGDTGESPLQMAIRFGNENIIELLLQHKKTDVMIFDIDGDLPLHRAVRLQNVNIIKRLLCHEAIAVDMLNTAGLSALHMAVLEERGRLDLGMAVPNEIINLLLRHNCEVATQDKNGISPLHDAVTSLTIGGGDHTYFHLLLYGTNAPVNVQDNRGNTPLHYACRSENVCIADALLRRGANVNQENNLGRSPLQVAVLNSQKNVVELLLVEGADLNAHSVDNKTALDIAVGIRYNEHDDYDVPIDDVNHIIQLLEQHGGLTFYGLQLQDWREKALVFASGCIRGGRPVDYEELSSEMIQTIFEKLKPTIGEN